MPDLKTSLKTKSLQWTLGAFGGGAGLVLGVAAIKAVMTRPEFLPQLLNGGFLGFAALIFGMVIFDKKSERFLAVQERTVIAQEQLAANVGALVDKDSTRERRMDLLLGELTRNSESTASSVKRIEDWIDGQREARS